MSDPEKPIVVTARQRTRSPAYPLFSLRLAVELAEKIWKAQGKHPAHIDSVVQTIGYAKRTGASLRAVAALAQFGLTKESGAHDNRSIALSDLGLDVAVGSPEQKRDALRTAALKPTIYGELWARYGQSPPEASIIQAYLIREKGFNPTVVEGLVSDYLTTVEFANLRANVDQNAHEVERIAGETPGTQETKPPVFRQPGARMTSNVRYLSIPLDIGDAPVPLGMSKDDWKIFIEALRLFKSRIVKDADESSTAEADAALDELVK